MENGKRQRAIGILGMHRSGTSAIARAVNLLGPYIGHADHLMKPIEGDNPHGFWEHWAVFSLHERLLTFLARSWDGLLPPPEGWWKQPEITPFHEELRNLITTEFAGQDIWLWKDPRTSLVLPLWKEVLRELNIDAHYLLCVRNPVDVASSLLRRNHFPKAKSLSLWLLYTVSSLYWTNGAKRIVFRFDDLIENWEDSLREVSTSLGIPWPQDDRGLRRSMAEFLRPEDRHSSSDAELLFHDTEIAEPVKRMYRLLQRSVEKNGFTDSDEFSKEIEEIYRDYCTYAEIFTPLRNEDRATHNQNAGGNRDAMIQSLGPVAEFRKAEEVNRLVFPSFSRYRVSIVIPVWNHWEHTYRCLRSVMANTDEVAYEVIVIDNGSSDGTQEMLAKAENIRVLRNQTNTGYVLACNQGAGIARGEYLLLLNNDAEPLEGWLRELVDVIDGDETVAAVGAKLVYADGVLQEAGGMMFHDGRGWNFGKGDDPNEDLYNIPCEVDYCSGACLLVRMDLFNRLGGFDVRYAPAYYEDADLCFALRKMGYRVVFNPNAAVVHHESVTAGADESSGYKKYLEINRKKFVEKWRNELELQEPHPSETGRSPVTSCRERLAGSSLSPEDVLRLSRGGQVLHGRNLGSQLPDRPFLYKSLADKEHQSIEVIKKAAGFYGDGQVGVVWTGDKDSTAILQMIRQAYNGRVPFTTISLEANPASPQMREFMERLQHEWAFHLERFDETGSSLQSASRDRGAERRESDAGEVLDRVVEVLGLKALIIAKRWDEGIAASPYKYFTRREDPPYVWVYPLLHFKEVDVWHYIKKYSVPFCDVNGLRNRQLCA
ncbi:MAG TPA: glycosyltransferase [Thermodesulfovibrionales bacterium]|nr:glycosyltransferase [Thermodesulfovibrionales bacterium]